MFVTHNQFFLFTACFAFGGISGVLFSISSCVKFFIKNLFLKSLPDVLIFLIVAILFVEYSYLMNFSDIRIYMFIGVFAGIFTYFKSLHILLAKFAKKYYNIIKQKAIERRKAKDERIKVKKVNSRNHSGRSAFDSGSVIDNGVSTYIDKSTKKPHRKSRSKNRTLRTNV